MIPITDYWNKFEYVLDKKTDRGIDVAEELKNLANETAMAAKKMVDCKDYERLANLFYQIQEVLLFDYGISSPTRLTINHCLSDIR